MLETEKSGFKSSNLKLLSFFQGTLPCYVVGWSPKWMLQALTFSCNWVT